MKTKQKPFMKGFVHIQCENCGEAKDFCTKEEMTCYRCEKCGHVTHFQERPKLGYMRCECGNKARYQIYSQAKQFDILCVSCGQPVAVELNTKKNIFQMM